MMRMIAVLDGSRTYTGSGTGANATITLQPSFAKGEDSETSIVAQNSRSISNTRPVFHNPLFRTLPLGLALLAMSLSLTACGSFFVCEGKADCTTGSTSTGTGDYVYVSNNPSSTEYISGYEIGSGTLTAITGSPFSVGIIPVAMKVSPNNDFLYVAAANSQGLFLFPINSTTGALGSPTTLLSGTEIDAIDISPDGDYLFTLGIENGLTESLNEYTINATSGTLGSGVTTFALPANTTCAFQSTTPVSQECSVQVSPLTNSAGWVGVALGQTGFELFPYTTSGGATQSNYNNAPAVASSGFYSLAFDNNSDIYVSGTVVYNGVAGTSALTSYNGLSANAAVNQLTTYESFGTNTTPRSVTLSTAYSELFTADEATGYISAFTVSSGTFTPYSTATFLGPSYASALGVDRSGNYLLAAGYNSTNGLQMFSISTTALSAVTSQGTGTSTSIPVVMALTH